MTPPATGTAEAGGLVRPGEADHADDDAGEDAAEEGSVETAAEGRMGASIRPARPRCVRLHEVPDEVPEDLLRIGRIDQSGADRLGIPPFGRDQVRPRLHVAAHGVAVESRGGTARSGAPRRPRTPASARAPTPRGRAPPPGNAPHCPRAWRSHRAALAVPSKMGVVRQAAHPHGADLRDRAGSWPPRRRGPAPTS